MSGSDPVLELRDLNVSYLGPDLAVQAVTGVSLEISQGEIFGLVGESGCGKSTLALATLGLLGGSAQADGQILVQGVDTMRLSEDEHRRLRGNDVSLVVQDPLTSLDPTYSVGAQLVEAIRVHATVSRSAAKERAVELLTAVGIPDPEKRMKDPPHRFSGGMRQRVVIAMALANEPVLLVADEPTTALDVTIQDQILRLIRGLREEREMAVLLITHDLGVVAQLCDRVGVMYAGQLVEIATTADLFAEPRHPYTRALLGALPTQTQAPGELAVIPGSVPNLASLPEGCRFAPRCPHRMEICGREPELKDVAASSSVACWLYEDGPGASAAGSKQRIADAGR